MAQRAVITFDGCLYLETEAGVWSDGDVTYTTEDLDSEVGGYGVIEDVDAVADRVARLRAADSQIAGVRGG